MALALSSTPKADIRLKRLISNGYFPSELPPTFTTKNFGKLAVDLAALWQPAQIKRFWTKPEHYSIPKYGDARRMLSIVNPINQLLVAQIISQNWPAIKQRLTRSRITEFRPKIITVGNGRAVSGVDFDGVSKKRLEILGNYGRYVKTDIARFYPSIYTHAIAWSIVGKAFAKANHHTPAFKSSFANNLDKAVGAGQEGQTIGIPIGPDTSRIISELIAVEVEQIAKGYIPDLDSRAVRYVDDMLIGLDDKDSTQTALSGITAALYEYDLEINAEKTITVGIGYRHAPEWINYIRNYNISTSERRQREDLDSYFEQSIFLADSNHRDNVLLFATKRAATFSVLPGNMEHLVRWFLYIARRSPSCLSFVAEHLSANHSTISASHSEIEQYILQQIPIKADVAHTDELAWLLFWAREAKIILPAAILKKATGLRNSTIALLIMDIRSTGRISGRISDAYWKQSATELGLKSEMWMVAYEATLKGWWGTQPAKSFASGHTFFGELWQRGIEFYDPKKKARASAQRPFLVRRFATQSMLGLSQYPD